ncbi:MAG TPA: hypothetical protein VMU95_18400 [Trebonia sp.]|nr:hypothetical protein [Trebonia sp.]
MQYCADRDLGRVGCRGRCGLVAQELAGQAAAGRVFKQLLLTGDSLGELPGRLEVGQCGHRVPGGGRGGPVPQGLLVGVGAVHEREESDLIVHVGADRPVALRRRGAVQANEALDHVKRLPQGGAQHADSAPSGIFDRGGTGGRLPQWRMRLLVGLGQDRHVVEVVEAPVVAGPGIRPQPGHEFERLLGLRRDLSGVHAEQSPFGGRGAGQSHLEPAAGQVIQGGRALGHPDRMIDRPRREHGGVAESQAPRALRQGRQHDLRRGRQAELFRAVVLDLPPAVIPKVVGQFGLLNCLHETRVLVAVDPGPWILNLIE